MNNKFKSYFLIGGFIVVVLGLFLISEPMDEEIIIETTEVVEEELQEVEASGDARLYEIIEMAGGVTKEADIQKINLASLVKDEQKIIIPYIESRRF